MGTAGNSCDRAGDRGLKSLATSARPPGGSLPAGEFSGEHLPAAKFSSGNLRNGIARWRSARLALALGLVSLIGSLMLAAWIAWPGRVAKRFGVVEAGALYRSGLVTPGQLARLQRAHGVRRVVSFLDPRAAESVAERRACRALGLTYENVPLRGNGASSAADRERILALVSDGSAGPTLLHCAAGSNRTGLAVGLYRITQQGWSLELVFEELREYGFENGEQHENLRRALEEAARGPEARR